YIVVLSFFLLRHRRPQLSTLFPYTTLFRSLAMLRKKDDPKRQLYNRTGLIVSSGYLALTFLLKGLSFYQFSAALENQNIVYQERSEEHTSELQSRENLVCRLLLEKKN